MNLLTLTSATESGTVVSPFPGLAAVFLLVAGIFLVSAFVFNYRAYGIDTGSGTFTAEEKDRWVKKWTQIRVFSGIAILTGAISMVLGIAALLNITGDSSWDGNWVVLLSRIVVPVGVITVAAGCYVEAVTQLSLTRVPTSLPNDEADVERRTERGVASISQYQLSQRLYLTGAGIAVLGLILSIIKIFN